MNSSTEHDLEFDRRVNEILLQAFERSDADRSAFVRSTCGEDSRLLAAVEELLEEDETLNDFLACPVLEQVEWRGEDACERIGAYEVVRELGSGGMGKVYLAEQHEPIERRVAIKVLRTRFSVSGAAQQDATLRFQAEGQALARMNHPNIAQVIEVGAPVEGPSYIVMEYVDGEPIDRFCDRHGLSLEKRLELFLAVCAGVQHAHQKGVLHRDIKPSNILVTGSADHPHPKIIDFGLAKGFDEPLTEVTLLTGAGVVGTPAYLSPEMLEGEGVDIRSDIYTLGILLYQLLVGVKPFAIGDVSLLELLRRIREEEVPRASRLAAQLGEKGEEVARRRGLRRAMLERKIKGDLDGILLKATAKARQDRYASVSEFQADIERFQRHEPVLAGTSTLFHRLAKFTRRHRTAVAGGVLTFLALVAGLISTTLEAQRANRESRAAQEAFAFMIELFEVSAPRKAGGRAITARELLARGAINIRSELRDQPLNRARLLDAIGLAYSGIGLYDEGEVLIGEALEIRRAALGDEHREVASSLHHRGSIYRKLGKFDEAEQDLRQALELNRSFTGDSTLEELDILRDLGVVLLEVGRFQEALAIAENALKIDRSANGDPDLARFFEIAGWAHANLGQDDLAEASFEQNLNLRLANLNEEHPDIAYGYSALAEFYLRQSRFSEAEQMIQRGLEIAEKSLGAEHADYAMMLVSFGLAKRGLKDYERAEALYLQSLPILEEALGAEHPKVATVLNTLGVLYWYQERYTEAEPYYRRALTLREEQFGKEHPAVAIPASNLGEVYWKLGRFEEAIALLERAIFLYEAHERAEHPSLAFPLHALGVIHRDLGEYEEAESYFARALALRLEHAQGSSDLDETRREYALLMRKLNREEEAVAIAAE